MPLFLAELPPDGGVHEAPANQLHLREEVTMSVVNCDLDAQRLRTAKNQSLFREVNERIEDLATSTFTSFVCECRDDQCDERLVLTIEEYERVRAQPAWFFVLPGHECAELEDVVDSDGRYVIVRKLGVGERVAEQLNPRSRL